MVKNPLKRPWGFRKKVITVQFFEHFTLNTHIGRSRPRKWVTVSRSRAQERERREHFSRLGVSLALMVAVTVASVASVAASTRHASITVDGAPKQVMAIDSTDQAKILSEAGVNPGEDASIAYHSDNDGNVSITVKTAKRVLVTADTKTTPVVMHYGDTVADALAKANIRFDANDLIDPGTTTKVTSGMTVTVTRRCNISVVADGKTTTALVEEGTVARALTQAKIELGENDIADKALTTQVSEGMTISVGRVTYKDVTSTEAVPFETVTQNDSSMNQGTRKVKTQGQNGVKTIVTRQKFCNGTLAESDVTSSEVTQQPVSQVVLVGTRSLGSAFASVGADGSLVDQNGNSVSYRKVFTGRCTAYSGGYCTASGRAPAYGRVAVNPNIIPYGTKLYICSPNGGFVYGYAVAADTGGAAMSGTIVADLYYNNNSECLSFGSRTMNVYVLG